MRTDAVRHDSTTERSVGSRASGLQRDSCFRIPLSEVSPCGIGSFKAVGGGRFYSRSRSKGFSSSPSFCHPRRIPGSSVSWKLVMTLEKASPYAAKASGYFSMKRETISFAVCRASSSVGLRDDRAFKPMRTGTCSFLSRCRLPSRIKRESHRY